MLYRFCNILVESGRVYYPTGSRDAIDWYIGQVYNIQASIISQGWFEARGAKCIEGP